ncbi:GFA family protein [Neptuniibacter pectenicola]|jgi:hypothetical protein|uniref:GFA family protein n=1 Tax=Neptuniibacter pectenicola TaxID=1806669 RepID=A0ABU9TUL8_9GAMM|nr:GFA family protein [Neptuniibacter pectenicola]
MPAQTEHYQGSCLCGSVHYEITPPYTTFQYCHCSRCRKATGSAHASNIIIPPTQFAWISGEALVGRYEPKESKHFANNFCKRCGSTLPWLAKTGGAVVVPAGTLDQAPGAHPERNIFWQSRAPWYTLPHQLNAFPTLPNKSEACCLLDSKPTR